jgi:hypothetical protein
MWQYLQYVALHTALCGSERVRYLRGSALCIVYLVRASDLAAIGTCVIGASRMRNGVCCLEGRSGLNVGHSMCAIWTRFNKTKGLRVQNREWRVQNYLNIFCNRPFRVRGQEDTPIVLSSLNSSNLLWCISDFLLHGLGPCFALSSGRWNVAGRCTIPAHLWLFGRVKVVDRRIKDFTRAKLESYYFVHTELFWGSVCDGRRSLPVSLLKRGWSVLCALASSTGNVSAWEA